VNRLALRGLLERKARTAYTLLAVILGVALIAGTFVLTDTISVSFDRLVATAGQHVDVKVLSRNTSGSFGNSTAATTIPASLKAKVRTVGGVAASAGAYSSLSVTMVDVSRPAYRADAGRRRRSPSRPSRRVSPPSGTTAVLPRAPGEIAIFHPGRAGRRREARRPPADRAPASCGPTASSA
jgi:putative ABC transport system permease protein